MRGLLAQSAHKDRLARHLAHSRASLELAAEQAN